ncbi:hypothetical protein CF326_g5317 [Tilletia indica]|nr:hypothetical protein CF326_g5317 [Tilletia indica]
MRHQLRLVPLPLGAEQPVSAWNEEDAGHFFLHRSPTLPHGSLSSLESRQLRFAFSQGAFSIRDVGAFSTTRVNGLILVPGVDRQLQIGDFLEFGRPSNHDFVDSLSCRVDITSSSTSSFSRSCPNIVHPPNSAPPYAAQHDLARAFDQIIYDDPSYNPRAHTPSFAFGPPSITTPSTTLIPRSYGTLVADLRAGSVDIAEDATSGPGSVDGLHASSYSVTPSTPASETRTSTPPCTSKPASSFLPPTLSSNSSSTSVLTSVLGSVPPSTSTSASVSSTIPRSTSIPTQNSSVLASVLGIKTPFTRLALPQRASSNSSPPPSNSISVPQSTSPTSAPSAHLIPSPPTSSSSGLLPSSLADSARSTALAITLDRVGSAWVSARRVLNAAASDSARISALACSFPSHSGTSSTPPSLAPSTSKSTPPLFITTPPSTVPLTVAAEPTIVSPCLADVGDGGSVRATSLDVTLMRIRDAWMESRRLAHTDGSSLFSPSEFASSRIRVALRGSLCNTTRAPSATKALASSSPCLCSTAEPSTSPLSSSSISSTGTTQLSAPPHLLSLLPYPSAGSPDPDPEFDTFSAAAPILISTPPPCHGYPESLSSVVRSCDYKTAPMFSSAETALRRIHARWIQARQWCAKSVASYASGENALALPFPGWLPPPHGLFFVPRLCLSTSQVRAFWHAQPGR